MVEKNEQLTQSTDSRFNICLINPALLPNWFWVPTAYEIESQGHTAIIPDMIRGNTSVTVEDNVDIIEKTMKDYDQQFVVVLSRGVEFGIRYIDRLIKQRALEKVVGWMIISSVGPRGYEVTKQQSDVPLLRHTLLHSLGISTDKHGLQSISPETAKASLLHDLNDGFFKEYIASNLVRDSPLSQQEVSSVPMLDKNILPLSWYIGLHDKVDNIVLSAAVAEERFDVIPKYTQWGHIGPLTHTTNVTSAIIDEATQAQKSSKRI